jgi:hypothetical protein
MPKFTQIPQSTFEELQINAGILLKDFDIETGTYAESDFLTATTGGIQISVKGTYEDFGSDIDNCPKNTLELKRKTDADEVSMSTTALCVSEDLLLFSLGAADKDDRTGAIKPRRDLKTTDFKTLWWVGDKADGGFVAAKISNALSTDGFTLKTTDKGKGQISLGITGHVSIHAQDVVPAEFYIENGDSEAVSIKLDRTMATIEDGATLALTETVTPADATVTWDSSDTDVATVSDGIVTAVDAGTCVIIAKATKSGEEAIATCIINVTAAEQGEG